MHRSHRIGWLRAAVLGANDGIVSTASLVIGVAAAASSHSTVMLAGVAGLFAGALSMAAGEYVSVSFAGRHRKSRPRTRDESISRRSPNSSFASLPRFTRTRGLEPDLAAKVARQLMEHDALGAHARDELGITEVMSARPLQAAVFSAVSFSLGRHCRFCRVVLAGAADDLGDRGSSLVFLALLGAVGRTGRRRGHREGVDSRAVLGSDCDGRDRVGRKAVWSDGLDRHALSRRLRRSSTRSPSSKARDRKAGRPSSRSFRRRRPRLASSSVFSPILSISVVEPRDFVHERLRRPRSRAS